MPWCVLCVQLWCSRVPDLLSTVFLHVASKLFSRFCSHLWRGKCVFLFVCKTLFMLQTCWSLSCKVIFNSNIFLPKVYFIWTQRTVVHFDALQEDNTRLKTFFRSYHEKPSIVSETSNARPHRNLFRYMTDFKRINHCEHMRKLRAFSFKGAVVCLCLFTVWSSSICSSTYSHSFLFVSKNVNWLTVRGLLFTDYSSL